MQKGKLILGVAAFIVTAVSVFVFKAHAKVLSGGANVFGSVSGFCTLTTCKTGGPASANTQLCLTRLYRNLLANTVNGHMFRTNTCTKKPVLFWTHNQ